MCMRYVHTTRQSPSDDVSSSAISTLGATCPTISTGTSAERSRLLWPPCLTGAPTRWVAFDEARARLLSMPEAIAAAGAERPAEIVGLLVERVTGTRTTGMMGREWTAPGGRFSRRVLSERAVWDSNPRHED